MRIVKNYNSDEDSWIIKDIQEVYKALTSDDITHGDRYDAKMIERIISWLSGFSVLSGMLIVFAFLFLEGLTTTFLPSLTITISPCISVRYTFTFASRNRLKVSSVGCP